VVVLIDGKARRPRRPEDAPGEQHRAGRRPLSSPGKKRKQLRKRGQEVGNGRAIPRWGPGRQAFAGFLLLAAGLGAWAAPSPGRPPPEEQPVGAPLVRRGLPPRGGLSFRSRRPGPSATTSCRRSWARGWPSLMSMATGLLDVYLVHAGGAPPARRTSSSSSCPTATFKDVQRRLRGWTSPGSTPASAVGDVNNDGWPDLVVVQYGRPPAVPQQRANGTFTDATGRLPAWKNSGLGHLRCLPRLRPWTALLDLVVVNYRRLRWGHPLLHSANFRPATYCHPIQFPGQPARLFRKHGASVRAARPPSRTSASARALGQKPGPGLGVVCADFDGDGYPRHLRRQRRGPPTTCGSTRRTAPFKEEAVLRGLAFDGMGRGAGEHGAWALGDGRWRRAVRRVRHPPEQGDCTTLWLQGATRAVP